MPTSGHSSTSVSWEWLVRFLEHRIADRRLVRLIGKWLKAGVLEDGRLLGGRTGHATGRGDDALNGKGNPWSAILWSAAMAGVVWRSGRDRNRMPNGDGVVADEDLLHHEADDPLPVVDIKRIG